MANVISSKTVKHQTPSESFKYVLKVSGWVSSISGTPTILKVVDLTDEDTDVSGTVVGAGSATVSGTDITLPAISSLTIKHRYRVHVNFVDAGSNTWEANFIIECRYD